MCGCTFRYTLWLHIYEVFSGEIGSTSLLLLFFLLRAISSQREVSLLAFTRKRVWDECERRLRATAVSYGWFHEVPRINYSMLRLFSGFFFFLIVPSEVVSSDRTGWNDVIETREEEKCARAGCQ